MANTLQKTPFYEVADLKSGFNYTRYITGFTFEDCVEKDSEISFKLEGMSKDQLDKINPKQGDELSFRFGYLAGAQSELRKAIIDNVDPSHSDRIIVTITAFDKGFIMKGGRPGRVFSNKTASEIAREIANIYAMPYEIEATTERYPQIIQGQRTDFELLRYLAGIQKSGAYRFYIQDNKLTFKTYQLDTPAVMTFSYNIPGAINHILSFKSTIENREGKKSKSKVSAYDSKNKKIKTKEVTAKNADKNTNLGNNVMDNLFQDASGFSSDSFYSDDTLSGTANNQFKSASKEKITADLETVLNPNIVAGDIITVEGVLLKDSGNWYVEEVHHQVDSGGGRTRFKLQKNATAKPASTASVKTQKVNKSKGADTAVKKKEVFKYSGTTGKRVF